MSPIRPPAPSVPGARQGRRGVLGLLAAPALVGLLPRRGAAQEETDVQAELTAEWAQFRGRYVTREGRVLDTAKGNESHTEGQGFGLIFAAEAGDAVTFDRILDWTRRTLRRRDHLHAWRYRGDAPDPVADRNNATDGDILIAWGMIRGAELLGRTGLEREAVPVIREILARCTREVGGRLLLLPGTEGFEKRDHVVVNPSYYVYPALAAFERLVPSPHWGRLIADGLDLCCRQARFGRWALPADWIEVPRAAGAQVRLAAGWPTRFSWDALRVPLYLAWARRADNPALEACIAFWSQSEVSVPAWADLRSDSLAPYPGHAGVRAVASLARATREPARRLQDLPRVADAPDYYGASLVLMARIAWQGARAGAATI